MGRSIHAITRISIGLAMMTLTVLLTAQALGLLPDQQQTLVQRRSDMSRLIALQFAQLVEAQDLDDMYAAADALLHHQPELRSIGLRHVDGELLMATSDHIDFWRPDEKPQSDLSQVQIPMYRGDRLWANVELRYQRVGQGAWWTRPGVRLIAFITLSAFLTFLIYLRRMLRQLNPSAVIPDRVKAMLDTLTEGVLVLDKAGRVIMANQAFTDVTGVANEQAQGQSVSKIPWTTPGTDQPPTQTPWAMAGKQRAAVRGVALWLKVNNKDQRTFMVNAAPIYGSGKEPRGILVTFDDVTQIEQKNSELQKVLGRLRESREKIKKQNEELKLLATRDALTGCVNRRAFFEEATKQWSSAKRYKHELSCVMVDVDHFKSINDTHGHAVGDEVLKTVAAVLQETARESDTVCRYGGEEFCIMLTHTDIEHAALAGERFRNAIAQAKPNDLTVTASLGVSSISNNAEDFAQMVNQADQALYAAKHGGRNRVMYFDPSLEQVEAKHEKTPEAPTAPEPSIDIPFEAVSALLSALSMSDQTAAAHCQRVSDLCVAVAQDVLSPNDCFVLEIAALMHDVGKIGAPVDQSQASNTPQDAGRRRENLARMSEQVIQSAFDAPELSQIVRHYAAPFAGKIDQPDAPRGREIPLRARILAIANAYDQMTHPSPHGQAISHQEAIEALQRNVDCRFDPQWVQRFIEVLSARREGRSPKLLETAMRTAVQLAIESERLSAAMKHADTNRLRTAAQNIKTLAPQFDASKLAELAEQLHQLTDAKGDVDAMLAQTRDLLKLCQSVVTNPSTPHNQADSPASSA